MSILFFLLALLAGVSNPFQAGLNAELNKQLGRPLWAGIMVYASGLLTLFFLQLFLRQPLPAGRAAGVPWWAWLGGLVSVLATMAGLILAQRMGSAAFTGITLTAALLTSVVLDHFALIGFAKHTASAGRLAGCALMIAGLWLIAKL